jgi:hypothetical protein
MERLAAIQDRSPAAAIAERDSVPTVCGPQGKWQVRLRNLDTGNILFNACNSRWHDLWLRFAHKANLRCPRHAGTLRQFECTRLMTPAQVIPASQRIAGLIEQAATDVPAPLPPVKTARKIS